MPVAVSVTDTARWVYGGGRWETDGAQSSHRLQGKPGWALLLLLCTYLSRYLARPAIGAAPCFSVQWRSALRAVDGQRVCLHSSTLLPSPSVSKRQRPQKPAPSTLQPPSPTAPDPPSVSVSLSSPPRILPPPHRQHPARPCSP